MGSKKKTSRVFGKGKGVHQKRRKEKHHGRPHYILKRSRPSGKHIKIKIKKLWKKHSIGTARKVSYISTILNDNHSNRLSLASTGKVPITAFTETRNLGLASVFAVQCNGCKTF